MRRIKTRKRGYSMMWWRIIWFLSFLHWRLQNNVTMTWLAYLRQRSLVGREPWRIISMTIKLQRMIWLQPSLWRSPSWRINLFLLGKQWMMTLSIQLWMVFLLHGRLLFQGSMLVRLNPHLRGFGLISCRKKENLEQKWPSKWRESIPCCQHKERKM